MRPLLFRWQAHVSTMVRTQQTPFTGKDAARLAMFATDLAHGGTGTTGEGITFAAVSSWPSRTRSRYMAALVGAGLVVMTEAPTIRRKGKPGRRARYTLVIPEQGQPAEKSHASSEHGTGDRLAHATGDRLVLNGAKSLASCERETSPVLHKSISRPDPTFTVQIKSAPTTYAIETFREHAAAHRCWRNPRDPWSVPGDWDTHMSVVQKVTA